MISARAPGKLILLGEYAVLEGAPALVMAVDRYAHVRIEEDRESGWLVSIPPVCRTPLALSLTKEGRLSARGSMPRATGLALAHVRSAVRSVVRGPHGGSLGRRGMSLCIDTSDFYAEGSGVKLGLGASAAVCAALVGGLSRAGTAETGRMPSREDLFRRAFSAHRRAQHGSGSGADVAASIYGGIVHYEKSGGASGPRIERTPGLPSGISLAAVWTGKPAATPRLLAQLRDFKRRAPAAYAGAIDGLARTSSLGCSAMVEGDADRFMECVERAYEGFDFLGKKSGMDIVSYEHREASRVVKGNGGVYKPSGAGVGDLGSPSSRTKESGGRLYAPWRSADTGSLALAWTGAVL